MPPLRELFGLGALAVLGSAMCIRWAKSRATFFGYSEIRKDVLRLARAFGGEVFRDAEDLAVRGNYEKWPVSVRFSSKGNSTVGIQIEAPANFQMTICPREEIGHEGRTRISTQDSQFDSKFATMTNTPTQARLFVRVQEVMALVKRVCSSSGSLLRISPRRLEVAERSFSHPEVYEFVMNQLATMAKLAEQLLEMPGAAAIKIVPYRTRKNLGLRVAVSAGLALAFFAAIRLPNANATDAQHFSEASTGGILPADAVLIGNLSKWRLVQEADLNPDAVSWLRAEGIAPAGTISGDFSGKNNGRDTAYILVDSDKMMRVVIISQGVQVYDQRYQQIALAVRVPHSALQNVTWKDRLAGDSDGDGLLVVARADDRSSGLVFTLHDRKVLLQLPTDYQNLSLF